MQLRRGLARQPLTPCEEFPSQLDVERLSKLPMESLDLRVYWVKSQER